MAMLWARSRGMAQNRRRGQMASGSARRPRPFGRRLPGRGNEDKSWTPGLGCGKGAHRAWYAQRSCPPAPVAAQPYPTRTDPGAVLRVQIAPAARSFTMADAATTSTTVLSPEAMGSFDAEGNYTPRTIVDVDPTEIVKLGEHVEALVLQKEDKEGRLVLSKKRAQYERAWTTIEEKKNKGEMVSGPVIEVVKGGLIVDIGLRGFLPASLGATARA